MPRAGDKIAVLGAGSWGTALASVLASGGHRVALWAFEPEVADGINAARHNPIYLSDVPLPEGVDATTDIFAAIADATMVLFVIPAQIVRGYVARIRDALPNGAPLVICSKGIERHSLATMDQVFAEELPAARHGDICVLSGPSFALEVGRGMPANVTVACADPAVAKRVQGLAATRNFRVYSTDDMIGVEIGGALKNVIAIAVGGSDGLGLGNNARAGLITRGLAEITRLAVSLGGKPQTMLGLAGAGDLILTCTGDLSRNRTVGKRMALGETLAAISAEMKMVAEGVPTAESAHNLAHKMGVDLPITEQVYRVLYEGATVQEAMAALQDRSPGEEWRR